MLPPNGPPAAIAADGCYHCGDPLPAGTSFRTDILGVSRAFCCAGCRAVASTIAAGGFERYYASREAYPAAELDAPSTASPASPGTRGPAFDAFDLPEVQAAFVRALPGGQREASMLLEGLVCAACVWLVEQQLSHLEGVERVTVNYASGRLVVAWDPARTAVSRILQAVAAVGYRAWPYDIERAERQARAERRDLLSRLAVAALGMMQVMMYAVPAYLADGDMTDDVAQLMRIAGLVLTAPVALWSAIPFYRGAWRDVRARRLGMDVPVALGIVAATIASTVATLAASGEVYFDTVTMFVFLLLGARYLERGARAAAGAASERLARIVPALARRVDPASGADTRVPVARLVAGDRVRVGPGEVIAVDGIIEHGATDVDESLLTGESHPVHRAIGDRVTGGSLNASSTVVVRALRVGADATLAVIGRLVERAAAEKPGIARIADRVAGRFVWSLLALALIAAAAWSVIDPSRALSITVAVLVVSCPCALSLATPAAMAVATGDLLRRGVLVTRGHALEALAAATHVVFDKTGTLTAGDLRVVGVVPLRGEPADVCLALAQHLDRYSTHPVARAIRGTAAAERREGGVADVRDVTGEGVEGMLDGRRLRVGRPSFVSALHGAPLPPEATCGTADTQVVALGDEAGWIALILLADAIRPEAQRIVQSLQAEGRQVVLASGDRHEVVEHLARELGIATVLAEARPGDKVALVERLQAAGAIVAMIGDGINDAPVLARAQVSIAVGGATDIAAASADVVLTGHGIAALPDAFGVARRARRVVRQNLAWAFGYNLIAIPAAALGVVAPWLAALGMSASSLVVVVNALRLRSGTPVASRAPVVPVRAAPAPV
jgi:Cu2+-exporting ATPase